MGFTFQINNDVKFNHNENLLAKANHYKPTIKHRVVKANAIVEIRKNMKLLEGYGARKVADINRLGDYQLTRDDQIILDFGNHQVGHFSMDVKSVGSPMDSPLFLKIKFAEVPAELMHESKNYRGWLSKSWIQEEYVHLDTLPTKLELPRRYSFRYVEITVLDTSPKWQVVFKKPTVLAESSVSGDNLSVPKLDDPEISKIYQVGLKTLEDCMQDVFEDGPKRDRRLWLGDLRLQALANYATFKDTNLVKRCLYLFGAMTTKGEGYVPANVFTRPSSIPDDTFLFDYSLFFISVLTDYEAFKRDPILLDDLYQIAKQQINVALKRVANNGELQLTTDYPVFVDWSNDFDKTTAGQAILIYTLRQFISLAKQVNDPQVFTYQKKLIQLINYSKMNLFDKTKGLFVSGTEREINIASQIWMALAHVLDDSSNRNLMQSTIHQLFPIKGIATPYMYHHITEALFETGLRKNAIKLMKDYWGKMILLGADTYWEAFDPNHPNYSPYGSPILNSYCHAWSCTPVYLINKYLI